MGQKDVWMHVPQVSIKISMLRQTLSASPVISLVNRAQIVLHAQPALLVNTSLEILVYLLVLMQLF